MSNYNKIMLIDMYTRQKLSLLNISKCLNIPISTIRCRLLKLGIKLRSHKEAAIYFRGWGSWLKGKKRKPFTKEHKQKISCSRIKSDKFKGTTLKPSGYLEYTRGEYKYRGVHAVIMEKHLGRKLKTNEVVHHKNEVRNDNRRKGVI